MPEAGDGAELWLMGFADTDTFATVLDKDNAEGASNRSCRPLTANCAVCWHSRPLPTTTPSPPTIGFDADVTAGMAKAQGFSEWAADQLYAPFSRS